MVRWSLGAWMVAVLVAGTMSPRTEAFHERALVREGPGVLSVSRFLAGQTPAGEDTAARIRRGAMLYAQRCADCHGADATGEVGPDLTGLWMSGMNDDRVFATIRFGRSGSIMPPSLAPDDDVRALVAYLKSLGTTSSDDLTVGDARHGEEVFRSMCAECHQVNGQGGRLGPDLTRIAEARSRAELAGAIRHPSGAVAPGYRTVRLVTRDGQQLEGTMKGEDAFSIQIIDTNERLQGYLKADLREVIHEDESLMPEFGPDQLSDSDLDDVLRFLGSLRTTDGGQR